MIRPGTVLALWTAVVLAGCIGPTPDAEGCTVTVPRLRAGAELTYAADGPFQDLSQSTVADWRWFGGEGPAEWPVRLPNGSTLRIAASTFPKQRLSTFGTMEAAWQVTWWFDRPDQPSAPARETFLDPDNGHQFQIVDRAAGPYHEPSGDTHHMIRWEWHRTDRPPLLGAPLTWDRPLTLGDRIAHSWHAPNWSANWAPNGTVESLRLRVAETWSADGVCRAHLEGTATISTNYYEGPGPTTSEVSMVVADDRPLPIRYRWASGEEIGTFTMHLTGYDRGPSVRLPGFEVAPNFPSSGLDQVPLDAMWDGSGELYPTSFDRAVEAIRDTEEGGEWLSEHPDATTGYVQYTQGSETSRGIDDWHIQWHDANKTGTFRASAERRRRDPVGVTGETEMHVHNVGYPPQDPPGNASSWTSVRAMARVSQTLYGEPPEIISCHLDRFLCHVATQEAMKVSGTGRVGTGTAVGTAIHPGSGLVAYQNSFSTHPLPEPVR